MKPAAYVEDLALRFGNSALKHRTAQIANDGSQKLPQRIVAAAMGAWIAANRSITWHSSLRPGSPLLSRQPDTFTDALDPQFVHLDPSSNIVEQIFTIAGFASGDPHRIPFAKQVATRLARIDESGVAAALGALNGKAWKYEADLALVRTRRHRSPGPCEAGGRDRYRDRSPPSERWAGRGRRGLQAQGDHRGQRPDLVGGGKHHRARGYQDADQALQELLDNYKQSIRAVSRAGIKTVCYNFMAITDWTRTDLDYPMPHGGLALRFDVVEF